MNYIYSDFHGTIMMPPSSTDIERMRHECDRIEKEDQPPAVRPICERPSTVSWYWYRMFCRPIPSPAMCLFSAIACGTEKYSTYRSAFATVEYRWHPLHGKRLAVFRRAGHRGHEVLHVDAGEDFSRELPAWMCDAGLCSAIQLGAA